VKKRKRKHSTLVFLQDNATLGPLNASDDSCNNGVVSTTRQHDTYSSHSVESSTEQHFNWYIRFSLNFQRYVLFSQRTGSNFKPEVVRPSMIRSFTFLDEALNYISNKYNNSNVVMLNSQAMTEFFRSISTLDELWTVKSSNKKPLSRAELVGDPDEISNNTFNNTVNNDLHFQNLLHQLATLVQPFHPKTKQPYFTLNETKRQLAQMIPRQRFFQASLKNLSKNYEAIMELFTRYYRENTTSAFAHTNELYPGLCFSPLEAQEVISTFPHIVLYDIHELEERIKVMTLPLPPLDQLKQILRNKEEGSNNKPRSKFLKEDEVDWPLLVLKRGYGAGFSLQQATECIRAVPELLALYHDDAIKPSIPYFYTNWKITPADADAARYNIIDGLVGCSASDSYCFAFMHQILGIPWASINIMTQAMPSTIVCDTVPWELLIADDRSAQGGRGGQLKFHALNFLRQRLQVSPTDVHFMIKTHSKLGGYGVQSKMKPTLDDIQFHLGLSCTELRKVILRMPSLIGMKTANKDGSKETTTFFRNLLFFQQNVGMSLTQLRSAVIKQPALLQYSIEGNLRHKLDFFTNELGIDKNRVASIIAKSPSVFGLSLRRNLRPKIDVLMDECLLTSTEVGSIVSAVPAILLLSVTRKILPTLWFLTSALLLEGQDELGKIILNAPGILLHGVETSLLPKVKLIEDALQQKKNEQPLPLTKNNKNRVKEGNVNEDDSTKVAAASIVKNNPGLLLTARHQLEERLNRILKETKSISSEALLRDRLLPTNRGRKKLSVTQPDRSSVDKQDLISANKLSDVAVMASNETLVERESDFITLLVLGRVYPSDDPNGVRGVRKSDGITVSLIYHGYPQENDAGLSKRLRTAANACYGSILPEGINLTNYDKGLVCLGASVLRASRRRCDLYSCHAGLKICLQLLKHSMSSLNGHDITRNVVIKIFTDSQYALDLLKDSRQLDRWASQKSMSEFSTAYKTHAIVGNNEASPPLHFINSDILFPLCQTYKRLKDEMQLKNNCKKSSDVNEQEYGKISVEFRHVGEKDSPFLSNNCYRTHLSTATRVASEAAAWQYNRAKHAGHINQ